PGGCAPSNWRRSGCGRRSNGWRGSARCGRAGSTSSTAISRTSRSSSMIQHDPRLDLVLERGVDVRREMVWSAWTTPEHVKKWFTPAPWQTTDCEIELRPGGIFRTVMRGPEGQELTNVGCYLEVARPERLVFTNVLAPGWRPAAPAFVPRFV